jgi:hypothetical protein
MSVVQMIVAAVGFLVIALVLWNIRGHRRHGDGTLDGDTEARRSDNWPAGADHSD